MFNSLALQLDKKIIEIVVTTSKYFAPIGVWHKLRKFSSQHFVGALEKTWGNYSIKNFSKKIKKGDIGFDIWYPNRIESGKLICFIL